MRILQSSAGSASQNLLSYLGTSGIGINSFQIEYLGVANYLP